jgi:hypothetical protein
MIASESAFHRGPNEASSSRSSSANAAWRCGRSAGDVARVLAVALALALLAPASSSAATGETCPPGTPLTPAYEFVEVGEKVPLVAHTS